MKDKILRLCKRLKKCSLDELIQISELEKDILETIILYLEQEGLVKVKDGIITICQNDELKRSIGNKNLNFMFQFHSPETIDMIMKGFCLEISPTKMSKIVNISNSCACNFYGLFKKMIFDRQFKSLIKLFFDKPQIGRYRMFYEKYAFFYVYNNNIYVSHKLLRASLEKDFTKPEIQEFKKVYSYLSRVESHNMNKNYMYYRLAEFIWRREKEFEELYSDLKNNLCLI